MKIATLLSASLLTLAPLASTALAQVPVVSRLDLDPAGLAPDGAATQATISSDGTHVAFASQATNLVPVTVGPPLAYNLFVREVRTGQTVQVNVDSLGGHMALADVSSILAEPSFSLSGDGQQVVFTTSSDDPVLAVPNASNDVYLRDIKSGRFELISIGMTGPTTSSSAEGPSISDDGRFVSFVGTGFEFVPLPGPQILATSQAYVRDRQYEHTELITRYTPGFLTGETCVSAELSGDGQHLAMLVIQNVDGLRRLKLADRLTGTTADFGVVSTAGVFDGEASISIDRKGERIVVSSNYDGLVPGDNDGTHDVFLIDVATGGLTQLNLKTDGSQVQSEGRNASISPDGRYVAFQAYGDELFPHPGGQLLNVFVHDIKTGLTTLGSINNQAQAGAVEPKGWASTFTPRALSEGGRFLTYFSNFDNLVAPATPGKAGVYLFDRRTGGPELWLANLTSGSTATIRVEKATPGGTVLVALSATGQGPMPSTWGILSLSPPLHAGTMSIDASGSGSVPMPVGLPTGQALYAQGLDVPAGMPTTAFYGVVR